jgi:hypothetical protein
MYRTPMAQLNLNTTPSFERALARFMRARGIRSKSEAIRVAVEESAAAASRGSADFESWLGLGTQAPINARPRFATHADLWK